MSEILQHKDKNLREHETGMPTKERGGERKGGEERKRGGERRGREGREGKGREGREEQTKSRHTIGKRCSKPMIQRKIYQAARSKYIFL